MKKILNPHTYDENKNSKNGHQSADVAHRSYRSGH